MNKVVLFAIVILLCAMAVSAQNYTVQEVSGRVERNSGGTWLAVSPGETLSADSVVRTIVGANLTVRLGEQVLSIGAMKNGRLSELASGGPAIQMQGRAVQTDTGTLSRSTVRVSTASARASNAAASFEFEE